LICHNAKAGGRDGYRQILRLSRLLAECGFEARIETDLTALPQRVDQAQSQGRLRAVVGAGGDGTMAALANLLPPGVPLIPMPMGTENLLAKHLGQAGAPREVISTVQSGTAIEVDAGRAGGKLFLLMISAGLDAEIVRRFEQRRGARSGRVKWIKPIVDSLRSYTYPGLRVYCSPVEPAGEAPLPLETRWLFGVNLPRYALGLPLAPEADGSDGLLDICMFEQGGTRAAFSYLASVLRGTAGARADCLIQRCKRFRVESDEPVPYQLDGDFGGWLPVEVEVVPGRLTLLAPPAKT